MKKTVLLFLCFSLSIITQISAMDKPSDSDDAYWNAWAATPLKLCENKEYIECLQARVNIAQSDNEERKQTVQKELAENEKNSSFKKPALKNTDAPVNPRKAAALMMFLRQSAQKK